MQILIEVSHLLTWQWITLIAILVFCRPLRRFLDRVWEFKIGKKGVSARATIPNVTQPGELLEQPASGQSQERIEAQHFVLRDSSGKKRAELGMTDTNSALLSLYDGTGRPRVALYAAESGASVLAFHDSHEKARVILGWSDPREGSPPEEVTAALSITDSKGNLVASLLVDAGGSPAFDLYSPSGESLFNAQ